MAKTEKGHGNAVLVIRVRCVLLKIEHIGIVASMNLKTQQKRPSMPYIYKIIVCFYVKFHKI